jgi:hypothetical protein
MLAVLAPVPAYILADGLKVTNPEGRVAFGTGENSGGAWSFEFFSNPEIVASKGELPVLIYGSATDLHDKEHTLYRPGYATAIGRYEDIRPSKAGKHPRPDFRPKSALEDDTAYPLFWEVSKLRALEPKERIPLKKLKLAGVGKLRSYSGMAPRGPLLVIVPDEFQATVEY